MRHIVVRTIALVLLLGVAFIFVSPMLDLAPTAMRAARAAQMSFLAIALQVTIVAGVCAGISLLGPPLAVSALGAGVDTLDLTCSRLC
ncbi:MAG: hypothetical protein ACE14M_01030 [Terriglobales bacterium]